MRMLEVDLAKCEPVSSCPQPLGHVVAIFIASITHPTGHGNDTSMGLVSEDLERQSTFEPGRHAVSCSFFVTSE